MCNGQGSGRGYCSRISVRSVSSGRLGSSLAEGQEHFREHNNKFLASAGAVHSRRRRFSALHRAERRQLAPTIYLETKRVWNGKEQQPRTRSPVRRAMGTVSCDAEGFKSVGFWPQGDAINAVSCLQTLHKLRDAPQDKCPGKKKIMLQHNSARHHTLFVCRRTAFTATAETSLPEWLDQAATNHHHTQDQHCAASEAVREDVRRWLQTAGQKSYR
jgi:hypothetical protein